MIQEALFDAPAKPVHVESAMLPPEPPKPTMVAESLGPCCKGCGRDAVLRSPGGNVYCAECGKCGGKYVEETALGVSVSICGISVEKFVMHPGMKIWCCPCVRGA